MKQRIGWLAAGMAAVSLVGCSDGATGNTESESSGGSGAGTFASPSAGTTGTAGGNGSSAGSGNPGVGNGGTAQGGAPSPGSSGQQSGGQAGMGGEPAGSSGSGGSSGAPNGGGAGNGGGGGTGMPGADVFGLPMLKPSRTPSLLWTSEHFATGSARALNGRDPSDPTGWSIRRGDTSAMNIDGNGVMSMGGPQPRFYIMPKSGETAPFFKNIEFTGYYRRTANDGASNAGFVVGMRSHPEGHGSDTCNTTTYYLAYRNSGTYLFDKELNHPNDSPGKGGQMFSPSASVPVGKWIGMKYIVYNLPGDQAVKLEAYIDADSDGNGTQPSDWKLIGETTDDGNWDAPTGNCDFPANMVITEGGGVVFIRNTDVGKVEYTKLSWREITN
jgi:hypothetical protein